MADERDPKLSSSLVAKAIDASTFTEMQAFTKDLEARPIERLLQDIADLVATSESKAHIVGYVIATKYRRGDENQRRTIVDSLKTTLAAMPAGDTRNRIVDIVDRIRTREG